MDTHHIHGVKMNFHTGTDHIAKMLEGMPKEEAMKFLDHAKSHGRSAVLDSRIHHEMQGEEDVYSVKLRHH